MGISMCLDIPFTILLCASVFSSRLWACIFRISVAKLASPLAICASSSALAALEATSSDLLEFPWLGPEGLGLAGKQAICLLSRLLNTCDSTLKSFSKIALMSKEESCIM